MIVVVVTLLAAFSMQIGLLLWKISAESLPTIGKVPFATALGAFLTSPRWMLGMLATAIGWVLLVKATDLGEISVVQPLMSVGDLFLIVVAVFYLHERLHRLEWMGLALTVVGAVILATEAAVIEPVTIAWMRLLIFMALVGGFFALVLSFRNRAPRTEVALSVAVGLAFGTGAVLTELFTADLSLTGKELESLAFFTNPILPLMIGANVVGITLLQAAFQRGRAAVIIPVTLSVSNGLVVIGGAIIFAEPISAVRLIGIAIIVAGTGMLYRLNEEEHKLPAPSVSE